jgi:anti-sigma regulatory factor (Ser/Thr protein kinase)
MGMTEQWATRRKGSTASHLELPRSPSSVAVARRFIRARAADWSLPEPAGDQLVLIGSELVTNAVLHARTELTLTLELRGDRVRISVKDRSQASTTLRHYRPDAPAGRGLKVVSALSDDWGISPAADGRVVWAELLLNSSSATIPAGPSERGQAVELQAAVGASGDELVRYLDVPVADYLELQAHNDALFRELELLSIERERAENAGTPSPLADLADLIDQLLRLYRRLRGQRVSYRDVVAAAQARGERTVELETTANPDSVASARGYLELLEQADELCRTGKLLTPEPAAHVKRLRRWFVEQTTAQLIDGASPRQPDEDQDAPQDTSWPDHSAEAPAISEAFRRRELMEELDTPRMIEMADSEGNPDAPNLGDHQRVPVYRTAGDSPWRFWHRRRQSHPPPTTDRIEAMRRFMAEVSPNDSPSPRALRGYFRTQLEPMSDEEATRRSRRLKAELEELLGSTDL